MSFTLHIQQIPTHLIHTRCVMVRSTSTRNSLEGAPLVSSVLSPSSHHYLRPPGLLQQVAAPRPASTQLAAPSSSTAFHTAQNTQPRSVCTDTQTHARKWSGHASTSAHSAHTNVSRRTVHKYTHSGTLACSHTTTHVLMDTQTHTHKCNVAFIKTHEVQVYHNQHLLL